MITRREFLALAGISAAAAALDAVPHSLMPSASAKPVTGRVLRATSLRSVFGEPLRTLFPESVVFIEAEHDGWYWLPEGRAARRDIQPVELKAHRPVEVLPAQVEVTAPAARLRRWSAPDAPAIASVGHGGVLFAVDRLTCAFGEWILLADGPDARPIGWSEARRWGPADGESIAGVERVIADRRTARVTVQEAVGSWSVRGRIASCVPAGLSIIERAEPVASDEHVGIPWQMRAGTRRIHGVYWHNEFGDVCSPGDSAQAIIELPPAAAKRIFSGLNATTLLEVF